LVQQIVSDVDEVFDALARDNAESALSHYADPLLSQPVSPAGRELGDTSTLVDHSVFGSIRAGK
jgi:hypothetical protein